MPPRSTRKRRAVGLPTSLPSNYLQVAQVDLSDVEDEVDVPTPTQTQREQRREFTPEDDYDDEDDDDDAEEDIHNGAGSLAQLSKSLVRYALACEYSRTPLKRADINQKVIALHKTVKFKEVFDAANSQLMDTFGMVMVELPNREKVTTKQKRAQQISESQSQRSNQYILQSTLPNEFRTADILTPAQVPTTDAESAYVGLYSLIISVIMLSGGRLSEMRLDRFLKRMNADDTTPVDSKDRLLARMIKDGYIVRIKDSSSGEDVVDYMVGPRGKVEVGQDGVADLVRMVYGAGATEEVERRLARSLGISERPGHAVDAVEGEAARGTQGVGRAGRSAGRRRAAEDEDEDG